MKIKTTGTKASQIQRKWHKIDLKGKVLGRVSTQIANLLMGKSKTYFVRHLDCGDYVVVMNAKDIVVTGKKDEQKKYYQYSGYPGGLKSQTLRELKERKPEEIIIHAVKGMLPQNKLRDKMLSRLHVFLGEENIFEDKFKKE